MRHKESLSNRHVQNRLQIGKEIHKWAVYTLFMEAFTIFLKIIVSDPVLNQIIFFLFGSFCIFTVSTWFLLVFAYWWEKRAEKMDEMDE